MSAPDPAFAALAALAALAFGALAATSRSAAAEPLPRVEYVTRALAAVRDLGPAGRDGLDRDLYARARTQCQAETRTPGAGCLIAAARAACASDPGRRRCEAAADVIITNLRAANAWVDEPARVRLLRGSTDYRAALAAELRRRYAALAAELVGAAAGTASGAGGAAGEAAAGEAAAGEAAAGEAAAIDQLCAHRDREIHACRPGDPACVPSLPWARCVAALVWFIGASP